MSNHKHRMKTEKMIGFEYCVNPNNCEPRAHGGVMRVRTCACGATQRVNSTGRYEERGPWVPARDADED